MCKFEVASLSLIFALTTAICPSDDSIGPKHIANRKIQTESDTGKSISDLTKALKHGDQEIRVDACHSLAALGPNARPALPALIDVLADKEPTVRWSAALAIGEIGPEAKPAVPALIKLLKDQESDVRAYAAIALGDVGREPAVVVPALVTALKNETMPCRYFGSMAFYTSRDAKRTIAKSLGCFGKGAVPEVIGLLEHSSNEVRWCALYSLSCMGPGAKSATDAICKLLQDKDERVCALAVRTLVDVEAAPDRVIPLLVESLKSNSDSVRYAAAESLGEFGPKAHAAVPLLVKVYNANDIMIGGSHWVVGEAIKRIDPEDARKLGIK
jgi:HEAT repeat protein